VRLEPVKVLAFDFTRALIDPLTISSDHHLPILAIFMSEWIYVTTMRCGKGILRRDISRLLAMERMLQSPLHNFLCVLVHLGLEIVSRLSIYET
jgi:hypothetical protein